ncbi:hypothetical protein L484_014409 [Morus notabilis]|uniref:Uncharacterized protein n=1 Tax=Morus notabilis TaxID=981085 RepID=W9RMP9_9ROSA|nr:hypothetical protein L484_014409 [Morus notabilis]
MQPMFSLHSTCGLPLCVSTITHHLTFSKDMADHDLRREAMKKHRSRGGEGVHANQEVGFQRLCERLLGQIKREADSDELLRDLSHSGLACIAKAA